MLYIMTSSNVGDILVFEVSEATSMWEFQIHHIHCESKARQHSLVCLIWSLAVLDPRVGHTVDVLSPFIPLILIDSSTDSLAHVLMLSIQAVRGLRRLRAPGIVSCHQHSEDSRSFALQFVVHLEIYRASPSSPSPLGCWTSTERGHNLVGPLSNTKPFCYCSPTLALASCFLYSLASKSTKCRGYPMSIIVTQSLSWEIESNAFLKSTKHI